MIAHFEVNSADRDRRRSPRHSLKLGLGADDGVVIRDMSLGGMLIESTAAMLVGTTFDVQLPHAGAVHAVVVWNSGDFYGCEFHQPITPATLSAAQLQSSAEGSDNRGNRSPIAELRDLSNQVDQIASELHQVVDRLNSDWERT